MKLSNICCEDYKNTSMIKDASVAVDYSILDLTIDKTEIVDNFPFYKIPNLKQIVVCKNVKYFDLSALYNAYDLKRILFDKGEYNHSIVIASKLPIAAQQTFDEFGWLELIKYRPELYSQIPSKIFKGNDFIDVSKRAVLIGMRERASKMTDKQKEKALERDGDILRLIQEKIAIEKSLHSTVGDKLENLYKNFEADELE